MNRAQKYRVSITTSLISILLSSLVLNGMLSTSAENPFEGRRGIQLVAANIQGGQTTQSVVVPMQRIAPITEGQTLYTVDLNGQITGSDPATGNPVTLNGNINALFLLNAGGQNVELSADNSAALNAVLS